MTSGCRMGHTCGGHAQNGQITTLEESNMAKHVLRTQDDKKVVIDVQKDVRLYNAPVNPNNTGTRYTTGTDLLVHKARSGKEYLYFYYWSMWQGDEDHFEVCSKETAEAFLVRKAGAAGWASLDEHEIEIAKEYGIDVLEETA